MSLQFFGTDGIRGTYGKAPISEDFAVKIAIGVTSYLKSVTIDPSRDLKVVIGRDTRFSGPALTQAFVGEFRRLGVVVFDLGVLPTPQIAFALMHFNADLGLAITASHNPVSDNGFKFFKSNGVKFTIDEEQCIETHINQPALSIPEILENESSSNDTTKISGSDVTNFYLKKLETEFKDVNLKGIRILIDTANGATCFTSPKLLKSLGADIQIIGGTPDGHNINAGVGSEHPENLRKLVTEGNFDFGIAHDGDGDRVIVVKNNGEILSGEHFMGIVARYSPSIPCNPDRPLITTSMSNFALNSYLTDQNIETVRTDVGDRNVAYQMFEKGCLFGGENSGHYICADILRTGDGLVAVLKLFEAIQNSGKTLNELCSEMILYPSRLLNLKVSEKKPLENLDILAKAVSEAESHINGRGRILLRYSGTENKLRILAECPTQIMLDSILEKLEEAARNDLVVTT